MLSLNKLWIIAYVVILILSSQSSGFAANSQIQATGEISYVVTEDGLYGIIGDDGKKYQPINLPQELRKNGLAVKFNAEIRDDLFSSITWGTPIKIKTIKKLTPILTKPERTAIYILLNRMNAFNHKDLGQLQKFDTQAKNLSTQQFTDWIADYNNFTLRYVEISFVDPITITGSCIYTRERTNTMTLYDNNNITQLNFTLSASKDGWKLTQSNSEKPRYELTKIKEQANLKYGTDDLASIWPE
jgi:hypothetical protein